MKPDVPVPGMQHPECLVACQRHRCLYIKETDADCIHRFDLSTCQVTEWHVNGTVKGLSVTKKCRLLITTWNPSRILEYSTEGKLSRTFDLNECIRGPMHALETSTGKFVLSHRSDKRHEVCVVDRTGRIVHSYGGHMGKSDGQLRCPRHLVLDSRDNVFVADCENHSVVLLSPSLEQIGYVSIPGHQLGSPYALHLDEVNRRLYIGEWTLGRRNSDDRAVIVCTRVF